jgi:Flp pilus assembly protein TadG
VRLARAEEAAAVVEFALVLPVFMTLIAGLFDGARLVNATLQAHVAAQAGAMYGLANGFNAGQIATAVTAATPLKVTPTAQLLSRCVQGPQLTLPDATGKCPGNKAPGTFVEVTATAVFQPIVNWIGVPWPANVVSNAWVRVK